MRYEQSFYNELGNKTTRKFSLENYVPAIHIDLDELLKSKDSYFWENDSVVIVIDELQSESSYNLYRVTEFNAYSYWDDKELDSLENLDYYLSYNYVMIQGDEE